MAVHSVERAYRQNSEGHCRPLGIVVLGAGALCTVWSFVALSWFTISGPGVVTSLHQWSGSTGEPVLLVNANEGTSHSLAMWAVVVGCIVTASAAQMPGVRGREWWMATTIVLVALGILDAIGHVSVPLLAVGSGELPSGTHVRADFGVWIAVVGLALLGISTLVTPASRRSLDRSGTVRA